MEKNAYFYLSILQTLANFSHEVAPMIFLKTFQALYEKFTMRTYKLEFNKFGVAKIHFV